MRRDMRRAMSDILRRLGDRTRPRTGLFARVEIAPRRIRLFAARLSDWALSLRAGLARDLDHGRGFSWLVVCYALGIWLYFELPREPHLWATGPLAGALWIAAAWGRWRGRAARFVVVVAAIASGVAISDLRTWSVATPKIPVERTHRVTGWVETLEARQTGYRLTVRPATISRLDEGDLPARIRVTGRAEPRPAPGTAVTFLARLSPPRGAVMPGGYAFDRAAYFDRIGGFGFVYGRVESVSLPQQGVMRRLAAGVAQLRSRIAERLRQAVPGDAGAIAAALIVGDRGGVSETAQENLRIAGLAHVLAISGMHMALVAGTIFFCVRAGFALVPGLALAHPIRAWAAAAALVAATAYLLISGGSIATQRAYVMAAVVFLAMIFARPALTMRSVAIAAALVLSITPEALLQPGFQMSFAAVIALVAAYRAWSDRRRARAGGAPPAADAPVARLRRTAVIWLGGLLMTSLIAGLATAPVALAHFHRASPFGLIANMAAMPLVSLLIMPAAIATALAMPFGLDPLAIRPMAWGIDAMLAIAAFIAERTPGHGIVGAVGSASAIVFAASLLWLSLWTSRWRLLGLLPLPVAILLAGVEPRPDIFIGEDGRTVAVRTRDGPLALAIGPGGRFTGEIWLRADGDGADTHRRAAGLPRMTCDASACIIRLTPRGFDRPVHLSRVAMPEAFDEDCRRADIIVTPLAAPGSCRAQALVFDRSDLARHGAVALHLAERDSTAPQTTETASADPEVPPDAAYDAPRPPLGMAQGSAAVPAPQTATGPPGTPLPAQTKKPAWLKRVVTARAGRHRPWQH